MRLQTKVIALSCSAGCLLAACVSELGDWTVSAVNDAGVMVGVSSNRAVRYENGALTLLAADPSGGNSSAVAIATDGTILGQTQSGVALWRPDGSLRIIGKMNGWDTFPTALNDAGTFIG
ncbi:MAG TPA: hypothetical protein VK524_20525, partial [Polyangiaceae bacterium]|nr:hypothetical protein [Polyangiaceae bacterium]